MSKAHRKILHGIGIGVLAAVAAIALWTSNSLNWLEYPSWDWRVRSLAHPVPSTDKIKLIILDQNSLDWGKDEQAWPWPWPRVSYGAMASFCARGGAKAVVFDFIYSEPSVHGVDDDITFGSALAQAPGSIVGLQLGRKQGSATNWPGILHAATAAMDDSSLEPLTLPRASFPVPEIATNCALLGDVSGFNDADKVIRRVTAFQVFDNRFVPSLGLAAYLAANTNSPIHADLRSLHIGSTTLPLDKNGRVILRYRGPSLTHKAYSAHQVIQSEVRIRNSEGTPTLDPAVFKDCYVLVGSSAPALLDLRASPFTPVYPAVQLHATLLDNILNADSLRDLPPLASTLLILFYGALAGLVGRMSQKGWHAAVAFLILLPLPLLPAFAAYPAGWWVPVAPGFIAVALGLTGAFILNYAMEGRQKRFIKTAFQQYLSPHFIDRLVENPEHLTLGGELRELTIYFSDVAGFTTISESLTPDRLTALLNEYLTAMSDIIMEEGGTVDKYEGDAIIAFWNAPLDLPDHAAAGVRASLRCQARLAELRPDFKERYGKDVSCRIGLNTGKVVIGNMGSRQRFNYTFLGDAGNLASRLEGANKAFGTPFMISEFTRKQLGPEFAVRELARLRVVGKKDHIVVYEPMTPADYEARRQVLDTFATGLQAFYAGHFTEAIAVFSSIADADKPAAHYLEKCKDYASSLPADWAGVWSLTEK